MDVYTLAQEKENSLAPWLSVLGSALVLACGLQVIMAATFGIFINPLQDEFSWSRTEIVLGMSIMAAVTPLVVPFYGWAVDRVNCRNLVLVSLVFQGLIFVAFSRLSGGLSGYYGLFLFASLISFGSSIIPLTKIINGWFIEKRGLALGTMFALTSIGPLFHPLIAHKLIDSLGWRDAYEVFACLIIFVGCGTALILLKNPEENVNSAKESIANNRKNKYQSFVDDIVNRSFFIIVGWVLFYGIGLGALQTQLVPILSERGLSRLEAATAQSFVGLGILVGNIVVGLMLDRVHGRYLAVFALALPAINALLVYSYPSTAIGYSMGWTLGAAVGAETSILVYVISRYFPLSVFGRVLSIYSIVAAVGIGLGPIISAMARDYMGNYDIALILAAIAFAAGASMPLRLGRYSH